MATRRPNGIEGESEQQDLSKRQKVKGILQESQEGSDKGFAVPETQENG
jgi:hypothetical protein